MTPTPAQLAILKSRFPGIGEPALIRNAATLLAARTGDLAVRSNLGPGTAPTIVAAQPAKKRLRQHEGDGMNRWERAYMATLVNEWTHVYREVSLPLANGLRFKVDFFAVSIVDDRLVIEGHEVKGRALPAGIAKIKMAARLYPWIKFKLATKRRAREGGGWAIEPVLP